MLLTLDENLDTLMENSFKQVGDIFEGHFEDIGMDEGSDNQDLVTLDSRLDVESVLIEDIKLDLDDLDSLDSRYGTPQYHHQPPQMVNSIVNNSDDKNVTDAITVIKSEPADEHLGPQPRDRCNTWPRQIQGGRYEAKELAKKDSPADTQFNFYQLLEDIFSCYDASKDYLT